jgi:hypothetical protein
MDISAPDQLKESEQFESALRAASVSAFHSGILTISGLMVVGGVISALWIRNPVKEPT